MNYNKCDCLHLCESCIRSHNEEIYEKIDNLDCGGCGFCMDCKNLNEQIE